MSAAASLASTAGLAADRAQQAASAEADLSAAREELAQRLAAAERKVFALTKERDALKREVERRSDTAELLKQKDDIIVQVMAEGERLSKRCADLEGTIKKLKAERKEQEAEKERLSQRLAAEAERTEAAKRERAVMEEELRSALDERSAELEEARVFYEEELRRARERVTEAESRADDDGRERLEKIIKEAFEREQALAARVEETQAALARAAESAAFREDLLRKDAREWESRCLAAEQRHEELAARIPESTRPLLRQIEALQATAASRTEAFAAAERSLTARVAEAEEAAQQTAEAAAGAKGKAAALSARLSELQAAHQATQAELASAQKALQRERELVQDARVESRAAVEAAAAQAGRIAALEHESEARLARQRAQVAEEKGRLDAAQAMWQAERRAPLWRLPAFCSPLDWTLFPVSPSSFSVALAAAPCRPAGRSFRSGSRSSCTSTGRPARRSRPPPGRRRAETPSAGSPPAPPRTRSVWRLPTPSNVIYPPLRGAVCVCVCPLWGG